MVPAAPVATPSRLVRMALTWGSRKLAIEAISVSTRPRLPERSPGIAATLSV